MLRKRYMEYDMDMVTKLIRQRDMTLSLAALSFVIWQGGQLAEDVVAQFGWGNGEPNLVIVFSVLVGAIGWAGASFMFLIYAGRVSKAKVQSVIQDELFDQHKRTALRIGYLALIAAISALLAADMFVSFSAEIAIRALLIVGIAVPLGTFVLLSTGEDGEAG